MSTLFTAFSDVDWAGCLNDRRSIGGNAIFWGQILFPGVQGSKQQSLDHLQRLSIKLLQMLRLSQCGYKGYFKKLVFDHRKWLNYGNNIGASYLSVLYTKHIEVNYHFVTKRVMQRLLSIQFVPTKDQIADGFTKPLSVRQLEMFRHNLKLGA